MLSRVKTSASNTLAGILEESRPLAYNDIAPHGFSLSSPSILQRLRTLEKLWVAGAQVSVTDEAFWDACYERHYRPLNFTAREQYLSLAARDEVVKLAAETEARMDEVAERAKTDAEKSNDILLDAIEELDAMGLERCDQELAEELERAMMEDWDYEAVQAASQPPVQESHFKRPSPSACTSKKRRPSRQLGRDTKRCREGSPPKAPVANVSTVESESGTLATPRTRTSQQVPTFALALRPKPKATNKSARISARKAA